jgi:hypothetical protein
MGTRRQRRRAALAVGVVFAGALALGSCGDDDGSAAAAGVGVEDLEAWCALIDDVDNMFEVTDAGGTDFATQQEGYAQITAKLEQLQASVDLVDESARADVLSTIGWTTELTTTLAAAEDESAAMEGLEQFWAETDDREATEAAAGEWIAANCGVDIDG